MPVYNNTTKLISLAITYVCYRYVAGIWYQLKIESGELAEISDYFHADGNPNLDCRQEVTSGNPNPDCRALGKSPDHYPAF
jgi:hypothetical protein